MTNAMDTLRARAPRALICGAMAAALVTAGCAGRQANPVSEAKYGDDTLNCAAIVAEYGANKAEVAKLEKEENDKVAQNVFAGAAGALFLLPLFLMDFQNAAGIDKAAMERRQARLRVYGADKDCKNIDPAAVRVAAPAAPEPGAPAPKCADVGGYESYMAKTGDVCDLGS